MASRPSAGRLPCAARPRVSTSTHSNPLVRGGHAQVRRLGHHGAVGPLSRGQQVGADAGVLLVGHRRHDEPPGRQPAAPRDRGGGVDHGGHAALHVLAAAPVEAAVAFDGIERRGHAVDADRVRMPAEQQRATRGPALDDSDDVGAARRRVGHRDIDAGRPQLGRDALGKRRPLRRRRAPGTD